MRMVGPVQRQKVGVFKPYHSPALLHSLLRAQQRIDVRRVLKQTCVKRRVEPPDTGGRSGAACPCRPRAESRVHLRQGSGIAGRYPQSSQAIDRASPPRRSKIFISCSPSQDGQKCTSWHCSKCDWRLYKDRHELTLGEKCRALIAFMTGLHTSETSSE